MDIRKAFTDSFNHLKNNKRLVYPVVLGSLLVYLSLFAYVHLTGFHDLGQEYLNLHEQYLAEYGSDKTNYKMGFFRSFSKEESFDANNYTLYLNEHNMNFNRVKDTFTSSAIALGILFSLLLLLFNAYFSCSHYVLIASSLHRKIRKSFFFVATFRELARWVGYLILASCIAFLPLAIISSGLFFGFGIPKIVWIVLLACAGVYTVWILYRLFFDENILFYDQTSIIDSIKSSYHITKGHFWFIVLLALLLGAISYIQNLISNISLPGLDLFTFLFSSNALLVVFSFLILLLLTYLISFVLTFIKLFKFVAYLDFIKTSRRK